MGCVVSDSGEQIDDFLITEGEKEKRVIKVLLLGSGESGKSTIFKQMKILHLSGFSEQERKGYASLIHTNTFDSIVSLINAVTQFKLNFQSDPVWDMANQLLEADPNQTSSIARHIPSIQAVWRDPIIPVVIRRANEFYLLDSAAYFLDAIERTLSIEYLPTDQDILRSRIPTTGVAETTFFLDNLEFKMIDVGGQRGERKKWIHCFDGSTAILFIGSLSEYDLVLAEDRNRNRMMESLDLFEGIVNLPWFREVPVILFLNKQDIFQKKIALVDIGIYFPAFSGHAHSKEEGLLFIQNMYFARNLNDGKTVYCHVTDATNTENVAFVWKATKHIIMEQNLKRSGLLMY